MRPPAIAGACLLLSLLTFFQFPGHTWLQQDSQIYAPILEHLRDPSVLRLDILAQRAHVAYTLYDEIGRALRTATGLPFRDVLALQQIAARAFGIWGLYLMALAMCMSGLRDAAHAKAQGPKAEPDVSPAALALFIAAICCLGAVVAGPSVLTFEYEPTPRAFALPLGLCAAGLTVQRRYLAAGIAAAAALLYHAPTVLPFVAIFAALALWPSNSDNLRRRLWRLAPLAGAVLLVGIAAHFQEGAGEAQTFFARLSPDLEKLQRMRAGYNWISDKTAWPNALLAHYTILSAVLLGACWRLRGHMSIEWRCFALGLPLLGLLSLPASWLLLDHWRWALVPQLQPMRAILFVTLFAQLLSATAGVLAAAHGRALEAAAWLAFAYLPPLQPVLTQPWTPRGAGVTLALALLAWLAVRTGVAGPERGPKRLHPYRPAIMLAMALAAFFVIPGLAGVQNYPKLLTPDVEQLSVWARSSTPKDAVFLFPDFAKTLDPGIFRTEALRAVYVDWKGGGQVNYLGGFAAEWWKRWQQTNQGRFRPRDLPKLAALNIQYVVLRPKDRLRDRQPLFESPTYLVYALP
ncbi:MAG TPA: DUF6798 domain-containing protein [Bryobacteraceae bacterium]|nr:DUF6798 domain-containing protein [Bryobacteraceae bacterium]